MSQLQSEKLIGRVLGNKFRLRSLIGAGSSGTVYQADQTALGRTVAVKILNPDLANDPRLVNRFHEEALLASRLNHPNTVSVIDYGQAKDGLLYIVMEYLRGITLTQVITQEKLTDARVVDTVSQILSGLEEAHHAGVIHADLKSDNIVVEHRRGGWDLVKVVDFGIARLIEAPPTEESSRTICGTPEYMAPELISGDDPTMASDLYAVGVVLYEMLAGETPYVGGSTLDVLRRHLREQPILPSIRRPDRRINEALEAVAITALAKKPADRFSSAIEFREALKQALDHSRDDAPQIACEGCGVTVSVTFKFCPECGHPLPSGVVARPISEGQTEPHGSRTGEEFKPTLFDRRHQTREFAEATGAAAFHSIWPLPQVGFEQDLQQLARFVDSEDGSVLQLVGLAGSGRSRLLKRLRERFEDRREITFYAAGPDPTGLRAPFHPIRSIIAQVISIPPACDYDTVSIAIESLGLSRRDLPGIAELVGHHGELWQLDPGVRQRELLSSAVRVLRAAASRGQLVLFFEDVDQYDVPSQLFLFHLAAMERGKLLRIIATNGAQFAERWPADAVRLDIQPLSGNQLGVLADHLVRSGHEGMPDVAQIIEYTNRSPGHIQHLVRFIVEGGTLDQAPRSLADLIAERIKSLPHPSRLLCQTVAVFGAEISEGILKQVLGDRLDAPFDDAHSILKARGLFMDDEDGRVGFRHELVRDVIYDSTPADVRRELHAAAVEALRPSVRNPLILGHHHEMAGNLLRAAKHLMQAGDDAVHQLDETGATALYQRGLAAARKLMLSDHELQNRIWFVTLSVKLAEALRVRKQTALARGVIEEAKAYCDGAPVLDAQLLQASARLFLSEKKIDDAITTMRKAIGLLIPVGQMELLSEFYLDLSSMYLTKGDIDTAIAELSEGIDLATLGEGESAGSGPDGLWRLLLRLAKLNNSINHTERSLQLAESALIHARRVRSRIGSAKVQTTLAAHYEKTGNLTLAEQYRDAAVNEMRRLGDRRGTAELLLSSLSPTRTLMRVNPAQLREARELADEVGWSEGVQRALEEMS